MMEDITNNQKEEFAQNEFPGKPINLIDRIMRPQILSFERLQGFKKQIDTNEQSEDVNAIKVKLIELIENKRLHIPEYQRPYRWTQKFLDSFPL